MHSDVSEPAPRWLAVPDDANDLVPGVWPRSARRDEQGVLELAGVPASELARAFGTPLLVIDEGEVRRRAAAVRSAFESAGAAHGASVRLYYAGKALLTTAIARWVDDEGLGVDVCTGGELEVALAAGIDPSRLGFHGNNKSVAEIERAVEAGVGTIIVDSAVEIERIAAVTARAGTVQRVLLRVSSGVHAETHEFLATAHEDQKFGFPLSEAQAAVARIRELPGLEFRGLHCHIGSQIFGVDGFRESASRVLDLHAELRTGGEIPQLNLGGGFGIAYTRADDPKPIEAVADAIVEAVVDGCAARGIPVPALSFEPGRVVVGNAGVTLYEVGTIKDVALDRGSRRYVSVDGGMSDNPRAALYGAQYSARLASRSGEGEPQLARVVGKHCESGDIVVDHEYLPADIAPGDLLAVPATGAYCAPLSSNYNHLPRPPVVAVRDGAARVIVRGETVADLLARDVGLTAGSEQEHDDDHSEGAR